MSAINVHDFTPRTTRTADQVLAGMVALQSRRRHAIEGSNRPVKERLPLAAPSVPVAMALRDVDLSGDVGVVNAAAPL
jgi:hypothetical protein